MYSSYLGRLEHVQTQLDKGLVSIDDKDAVSSQAVVHVPHTCLVSSLCSDSTGWSHNVELRDDREGELANSFGLQARRADRIPEILFVSDIFAAFVLTQSHHAQTSPSLHLFLPQPPLLPQLLRLSYWTCVLLRSRSNWLT